MTRTAGGLLYSPYRRRTAPSGTTEHGVKRTPRPSVGGASPSARATGSPDKDSLFGPPGEAATAAGDSLRDCLFCLLSRSPPCYCVLGSAQQCSAVPGRDRAARPRSPAMPSTAAGPRSQAAPAAVFRAGATRVSLLGRFGSMKSRAGRGVQRSGSPEGAPSQPPRLAARNPLSHCTVPVRAGRSAARATALARCRGCPVGRSATRAAAAARPLPGRIPTPAAVSTWVRQTHHDSGQGFGPLRPLPRTGAVTRPHAPRWLA
jgi:hypothetical protein